ncbi:hypothetical protein RhiirC2_869246 [Rhizophagus irregularis]|uniref:F-box domain-containing protein n=1 Tax=Rhizophagus irregularis TaxID=588596 RepID=A0A2N1MSB5_9GLOM|nr:hypothetical protein RhiirC2_869246 [Rhizophagus irregularis]
MTLKYNTLRLKSNILLLPNELLAEICENLSPQDLYSLSSVCKELRHFLWSDKSIIIQQIWRNSRNKFYPNLKSIPLVGMSEQQYVWFTVLAKQCQFCKESNKNLLKRYWEFQIICCDECLNKRIESRQTLVTKYNVPEDVLSTCLSLGNRVKKLTKKPSLPPVDEIGKELAKYMKDDEENVNNNNNNINEDDLDFEENDSNTASGPMANLPTEIYCGNSLEPAVKKKIFQAEPRNKDMSFTPLKMEQRMLSVKCAIF